MATERFNRQFVLLDFEDLDNPEFMAFVRSPEFSTYLIMRRFIWRSDRPHTMGLHEYYAQGLLACSIEREKIAEALGGLTIATVSKDISALIRRRVIKAVRTGRQNIYILGKWAIDEEDDVYYEYFFLDRLHVRREENLTSDVNARLTSSNLDIRRPANLTADDQPPSHNNREWNTRKNREDSNVPPPANPPRSLASPRIELIIDACSRDFWDIDHLSSNITRAYNLWGRTDLPEEGFADKLQEARRVTKGRISVSAVHDRGKKMAYFFAVLEDVLGLKKRESASQ